MSTIAKINGIAIAVTKEFWSSVTYGTLMTRQGDYTVARLAAWSDYATMVFHVPHDFVTITDAYIVVIPRMTNAAARWDIYSDYAAVGEAYNNHSEADGLTSYNVTDDQIFEVDISGILTSLAAGDYVGIRMILMDANHDVDVLGVRFKYV